MLRFTVLALQIYLFIQSPLSVIGEGALTMTWVRYDNPSGDAYNGHCCDGRSIFCQKRGCDYIFKVCLDDANSPNSTIGCQYGYKESRRIKNRDSIIFDGLVGYVENPMVFNFGEQIPSDLVLKIDVYDKDLPYTDNDFVDFLRIPVPPTAGVNTFKARGTRPRDKTRLSGAFEFSCDSGCRGIETSTIPTTTGTTPEVPFVDRPNADCDNLARNGYRYQDGVYSLRVGHFDPFDAYCDMSAEGWTVIQRRVDGSTNFFRNKKDYIDGFGQMGADTEYWLGLDKMYWLTNQRTYKLRITMQKSDGGFTYAEYERFRIDKNYVLHVADYSGTAGDALNFRGFGGMRRHNGMPFTTYDDDNDMFGTENCGEIYESGWWFNDCYWANLNGMYRSASRGVPFCQSGRCISWRTIRGYEDFSLIRTEMAILPSRKYTDSNDAHSG